VEALGVIKAELRNHDQRLTANHDTIAALREKGAGHDTKIEVVATELRETREDIGDLRIGLAETRAEQKGEMANLRHGAWTLAATFLMFTVAIVTLLTQIGH
jgi:hypothetical protein